LNRAVASGLALLVATPSSDYAEAAANLIAGKDVQIVKTKAGQRLPGLDDLIAAGVSASAGHAGWLVLPSPLPEIKPATLQALAAALSQHPIVLARHLGFEGALVGFGAELFSELIRLRGPDGVKRLIARYPSVAVVLDDPDIRSPAIVSGVRATGLMLPKTRRATVPAQPWD
jgi:molybdenum cofactor cytidylyltransferase